MTKFQQEVAVLMICNAILFSEFKTNWLGLALIVCTTVFVVQMWRGNNANS